MTKYVLSVKFIGGTSTEILETQAILIIAYILRHVTLVMALSITIEYLICYQLVLFHLLILIDFGHVRHKSPIVRTLVRI